MQQQASITAFAKQKLLSIGTVKNKYIEKNKKKIQA